MKTFILETTSKDKWEMSSGVCIIVAKDEARKLLNETAEYKGTIFNVIEVDLKKKGIAFEQGPTIE